MWLNIKYFLVESENLYLLNIIAKNDGFYFTISLKNGKDYSITFTDLADAEALLQNVYEQVQKPNLELLALKKQIDDVEQQILHLPYVGENFEQAKTDFLTHVEAKNPE